MRWKTAVENYAPFVGAAIGGATTRSLAGAQKGMQAGSAVGKIVGATDKQQAQPSSASSIAEARLQDKARMALQYGLGAGSDSED